ALAQRLSAFTPRTPSNSTTTASTRKATNRNLAMPAAPAATPVNPSRPATPAITAKINAHFSMSFSLEQLGGRQPRGLLASVVLGLGHASVLGIAAQAIALFFLGVVLGVSHIFVGVFPGLAVLELDIGIGL